MNKVNELGSYRQPLSLFLIFIPRFWYLLLNGPFPFSDLVVCRNNSATLSPSFLPYIFPLSFFCWYISNSHFVPNVEGPKRLGYRLIQWAVTAKYLMMLGIHFPSRDHLTSTFFTFKTRFERKRNCLTSTKFF